MVRPDAIYMSRAESGRVGIWVSCAFCAETGSLTFVERPSPGVRVCLCAPLEHDDRRDPGHQCSIDPITGDLFFFSNFDGVDGK